MFTANKPGEYHIKNILKHIKHLAIWVGNNKITKTGSASLSMIELSFKEISYIRAALEHQLKVLEKEIELDNNDLLEDPLTEDERVDNQEDIIFYDQLLHMFQKAEKQSYDLKVVQGIGLHERDD